MIDPAEASALIPAWVDGVLTPTGKLEAHTRGLRHMAVSVFVLRDGEVLLQRRAMGKYHTPGLWANACCTHPHWDEAPEVCARRRLDQELGIRGLDLDHRHQLEYRAEVGGGMVEHELVDVFVAEAGPGLRLDPDPSEVMETRWAGFAALRDEVARAPETFTPWLRIYLADHAAEIFGGTFAAG
ncbi:isopentenyl-diphosphate Delta-isomerase [Seohaeicola zhoushanensis]|uniref:Isopentenyl-diphosphate Delta-isomerase n=1 Tax=Seohaeicola zhoushanensis TaxID=1569283 RepID=A0A8J3GVH1_9RHOB|nr:isopentenyl-diphosphate Delta-isomerase [Seohaeicola zhoushanensis]GHF41576.1 isopentenyl-diphosphate Delta-isomerase [Seohaeicola zhoushanensis]